MGTSYWGAKMHLDSDLKQRSIVSRAARVCSARQLLVVGLLLGLAIALATRTRDPVVATFWISIALAGLAASAPVGWSIPGLIAPKGSTGSVGAIMNFSNNLMGIAAPTITGIIVGKTHSFVAAFLTAAVFLLVGIVSYIFVLGPIEPIPEPG